ncbi:actin nucleation-promoting factor WASL-like isoform X2 [Mercenaria mercenaria]|uniref:actin nucleation-promoting factor WASL-like isoform X2 n=1 Tax=Mercenaria mercenaria TaxID=6596 RepID=UPI00234E7A43|nr:actin nucleation-promoting factor WASL-like isoform X2 [Mercenaria mercenaria]
MVNRARSNSKSQLLSEQENAFVFNFLGKGCFTLATCVAQLFVVQCQKRERKWIKHCCGVVCFVKDNPKKSYFIRLYDIQRQELLWEQEIYTKFKYNTPREFFHTFEAHDCHVGLNFASEDEAENFKNVLEGKLFERQAKRLVSVPEAAPTIDTSPSETEKNKLDKLPKVRKRNTKKKLTKEDIGVPTDFRHVSHMSWGMDDGPHMDRLDSDMKALLEQIGIREKSQVDEDTMDFIYQFVDKHGGANAVREDFAWHIPAEPSQRAGETVDITKNLPAAPSHSVGALTNITQLPVAPSYPADKSTTPTRKLPAVPTGARLIPPPGVKVLDVTSVTRPPPPSTLRTRPPPTAGFKPQPPTTKPPPPALKPPSILKHSHQIDNKQIPDHSTTIQTPSPSQNDPLSPAYTQDLQAVPTSSNSPAHPALPDISSPFDSANMQATPKSSSIPAVTLSDIPAPLDSSDMQTSSTSANVPSLSSSNSPALPTPPDIPAPPICSPPVAISHTLAEKQLPAANNSRAGLLNEIHTFQGATLRHVQTNQQSSKRDGLLIQIRNGATLSHVDQSEKSSPAKRGSIAAALMSQLLKRKSKIQFSDNEYSSDEFDDDWDDD